MLGFIHTTTELSLRSTVSHNRRRIQNGLRFVFKYVHFLAASFMGRNHERGHYVRYVVS